MYEVFMSYGFRVQIIGYDDVARSLGREQVEGIPDNLLFVAEHLRFSDDEVRDNLWSHLNVCKLLHVYVNLYRWRLGGCNFRGSRKKVMKKDLRSSKV